MPLDFGKQVGPLPLGAWIIVVGGGLAIGWYARKHGSPDTSGDLSTGENPGVGTGGATPGWIQLGAPTAPADTPITTNEEWARKAVEWLNSQNYDPQLVISAVTKWLGGVDKLSVSESTLIGQVVKAIGLPPSPPQLPTPPVSVPSPTKPPASPPPKPGTKPGPRYRYYQVVKGDTLWGISKRFYGTGTRWGTIYNANRYGKRRADGKTGMIRNPAVIYPEWELLIP